MPKPLIMITGASSGVGQACAKAFSEQGHPLLLLARRLVPMQAMNLPNVICRSIDVNDYQSLKLAVVEAEESYGAVDALVNNAGVIDATDFVESSVENDWQQVNINVTGMMNAVKAVLPGMRKRRHGSLINISSIGDRVFQQTTAPVYCASKAAVKSFSQSLSFNYAKDNIRCCNVSPAYVDTPIWNGIDSSSFEFDMLSVKKMAEIILWIYQQPQQVSIQDLVVMPTGALL